MKCASENSNDLIYTEWRGNNGGGSTSVRTKSQSLFFCQRKPEAFGLCQSQSELLIEFKQISIYTGQTDIYKNLFQQKQHQKNSLGRSVKG